MDFEPQAGKKLGCKVGKTGVRYFVFSGQMVENSGKLTRTTGVIKIKRPYEWKMKPKIKRPKRYETNI